MAPLEPRALAYDRPRCASLDGFAVDVFACPRGQGRMKLLAIVKDPASIARYLPTAGEPTEAPQCSPKRGPP